MNLQRNQRLLDTIGCLRGNKRTPDGDRVENRIVAADEQRRDTVGKTDSQRKELRKTPIAFWNNELN